jgi:hypothetical protein
VKSFRIAGLIIPLSLALTACPSQTPVVVPLPVVPATPTMQISAKVEKNAIGEDCLTFAGVPSDDLIVFKVVITDPIARSVTYIPAGSGQTVVKNNPINLQDDGICYDKRSGPYKFEFGTSRIGGGAVTVNATYTQQ